MMADTRDKSRIRALHVGPGWGQRGGIASVLEELKGLSDTFDDRGVSLQFAETHDFGSITGAFRFFVFDVPGFVRKLCSGAEIVHLHVSIKSSFYRKFLLFLIARLFRARVVLQVHSGNFDGFVRSSTRLASVATRAFLRRSNALVAVSNSIANALIELGAERSRVHVIANTASAAQRACATVGRNDRAKSTNGPGIIFTGRLVETKGVGDLLEAAALLKAQGLNFHLTVAGSGDLERWSREVERLNICDRVSFPGWIAGEQKLEHYQSADIFCMPSHFEAFGIATLEAMFAGLPIVGTAVGGFFDLVDQGNSGLLVEPSNPIQLADALGTLLADPTLCDQMGRNSRERAYRSFTCIVVVDGYVDMYEQMVKETR